MIDDGYQFNRYFGLEAGYADFGEIEPLGSAGPKLEGDAAYLVAVGTVPFTDSFSGYTKAGINDWKADASVAGLVADDSGNDPTYGLGLQYRFTDNVACAASTAASRSTTAKPTWRSCSCVPISDRAVPELQLHPDAAGSSRRRFSGSLDADRPIMQSGPQPPAGEHA